MLSSPVWKMPATDHTLCGMMTKEQRMHSALCLQKLSSFLFISAKWCGKWLMQSFPLKFTDQLKQSGIVSDFKITHTCLTGSINLQCVLSAGRQRLTVILVSRVVCRLLSTRTWCMQKQCVLGSLSSSPAQEPGNETKRWHAKKYANKIGMI